MRMRSALLAATNFRFTEWHISLPELTCFVCEVEVGWGGGSKWEDCIFSSPERSPGRAITLPPASALASGWR